MPLWGWILIALGLLQVLMLLMALLIWRLKTISRWYPRP